ncbi:MAG: orotidine-5'-phosphate decarboxylase [Chloroflexi bacterium]|nr:orotidine-5'-phosphate decarboxylase [Chloroflexota bacterium]
MEANHSLLCVGLDPDPSHMPLRDVAAFNRAIIEATSDLVCAYKPNLGFYEAGGQEGLEALRLTLAAVPSHIPVIGDAKRGDVAPTSNFYAKAAFEVWGFDALTVNPYGGGDTLEPFLAYQDRGVLVWCRSSNPGAREFQDLQVAASAGGEARPLWEWVALRAQVWDRNGNVGLVAGATYPEELRRLRGLCPEMPFLVPGVGAQGGALEKAVAAGADPQGRNLIISTSRAILYASRDPRGFQEAARLAAQRLGTQIRQELARLGKGFAPQP